MADAPDRSPTLSAVATLIIEAGLASIYLGALVFIAGWSYADRYFAELGLNLLAVEGIDASFFSAYALWVFRDAVLTIAAFAVALIAGLLLARRGLGLAGNPVITVAAPALALATLIGAAKLGALRAEEQVPRLFEENYAAFVRIKVVPNKDSVLHDVFAARGDLGETSCLRKVFMDRRNLYAYAGYESARAPRQPILILPLSDIALIETVTNEALCSP